MYLHLAQVVFVILSISKPILTNKESIIWKQVCQGSDGKIFLSGKDTSILTIHENSRSITFVDDIAKYKFKCTSTFDAVLFPNISFEGIDDRNYDNNIDNLERYTTRILKSNMLKSRNAFNRNNMTVSCKDSRGPVCSTTLIVLNRVLEKECKFNNTLNCDIDVINNGRHYGRINDIDEITTEIPFTPRIIQGNEKSRISHYDTQPRYIEYTTISVPSSQDFYDENIKYSIYVNEKWVVCDELNEAGEKINEMEIMDKSRYIRCNVELSSYDHPYLLRMEVSNITKLNVALPSVYGAPPVDYSYFYVNISDYAEVPPNNSPSEDKKDYPGNYHIILISVCVTSAVVLIVVLFVCNRLHNKWKSKVTEESYRFYVKKPGEGVGEKVTASEMEKGIKKNVNRKDLQKEVCSLCDEWTPLCICDSEELGPLNNTDAVEFRTTLLTRQLSGDPAKLNPDLSLNSQAKIVAYNPKLEINRKNFIVRQMLGAGHFGCVYSGDATGLFYPKSKTHVAIKTVNDPLDGKQRTALFCEMKILSNLDAHLNLVNMLGSCTTEFIKTGEVFMLIEYCEKGDMKKFLIEHENDFDDEVNVENESQHLSSRLLIKWAFHIAKGMQYLARMHIMHGDLAARNILIGTDRDEKGRCKMTAKVSDFGLSKTFYDNIRYTRQNQHYIPWKWMALEYLQNGHLTITSDVWSYGVVLWEIFSFGKEPYINVSVEDMLSQLKSGYYLQCPDDASKIKTWNSQMVYSELAKQCFIADPMKRATFSDIVEELEKWLNEDEKQEYRRQAEQYESMRSVISNSDTQPKRSSTLNSKLFNVRNNGNSETKEKDDNSYLDMSQNASPNYSPIKSHKCPAPIKENPLLTTHGRDYDAHPMNYVIIADKKVNSASGAKEEMCDNVSNVIEGCDSSNGTNLTVTQSKLDLIPSLNNGYITIEAANTS